jgi:pimeloyl-ACP methyl ester carboxylesterase
MLDRFIHRFLRIPYPLHARRVRQAKRPRATVLFLHGIGSSGAAWKDVIAQLPKDLDVISVDLLGFGQSPDPEWAVYSAATQARSIIATLLKLKIRRQLIVVGHSMGALIAVEVARRYPLLVRSLVLCSPPFYNTADEARRFLPDRQRDLRRIYGIMQQHPKEFTTLAALLVKYKLVEKSFKVNDENVSVYMAALRASIVNQSALDDAKHIRKPMTILYGALDPVVIRRNLQQVVEANDQAKLSTVLLAGHAVMGSYIGAVVQAIEAAAG